MEGNLFRRPENSDLHIVLGSSNAPFHSRAAVTLHLDPIYFSSSNNKVRNKEKKLPLHIQLYARKGDEKRMGWSGAARRGERRHDARREKDARLDDTSWEYPIEDKKEEKEIHLEYPSLILLPAIYLDFHLFKVLKFENVEVRRNGGSVMMKVILRPE